MINISKYIMLVVGVLTISLAKKHSINIIQDCRQYIRLTSFGFSRGGYLLVNITNIYLMEPSDITHYLLTLDLTTKRLSSLYHPGNERSEFCNLLDLDNLDIVTFVFKLEKSLVEIRRHGNLLKNVSIAESLLPRFNSDYLVLERSGNKYSFHFRVEINCNNEVGLYTLTFHNCNLESKIHATGINMTVYLEEKNGNSYLSIGDMPLPILYFSLFFVYFIFGTLWLIVLCKSRKDVFKIHYLMQCLVCIKSASLLFHGINFRFIEIKGEQEEAFAILFYIVYLMKGILMFITIILIGAGWTFIKHILSEKEKKVFAIVIPLQILTNVAHIIMFETEESQTTYNIWYNIFILVDLVCCGAILFPSRSIRHLQQASTVIGKAAVNLKKLKIFRHFYIMVVFYIYFTRVIILLLNYTIPFQYTWLDELLVELATLGFFIATGSKFRPASNNTYLMVSQSDDEDEVEILTRPGSLDEEHVKPIYLDESQDH